MSPSSSRATRGPSNPGNAAASGVDLPGLTIALSRGETLPDRALVGTPGIRTRSALALALGAAERRGSRRAVAAVLLGLGLRRGELGQAPEVLTPVLRDPPSAVPLGVMAARLLADPCQAGALARGAVRRYAMTPAAVAVARTTSPPPRPPVS